MALWNFDTTGSSFALDSDTAGRAWFLAFLDLALPQLLAAWPFGVCADN